MGAGQTLAITNTATDPDAGQTLTFSLLTAPTGATLTATNGVFTWQPAVAQAGSTNPVSLKVNDSGAPSLSATQSFTIIVTNLTKPRLEAGPANQSGFHLYVHGDFGPNYAVQATSNLSQPVLWSTRFSTSSPALPFYWTDTATATQAAQFYRVQCE
jgi:hypothetical protein